MVRFLASIFLLSAILSCTRPDNEISLAGRWDLCLDSTGNPDVTDPGLLDFSMSVNLPSTLDSAGIGNPVVSEPILNRQTMLHLSRKVSYVGPAYYRREVNIPQSWEGKHITLQLERVIWESVVWIDGKKAGHHFSLSTPHEYDLSGFLTSGKHVIIICIDNSRKFVLNRSDMAHAYTEETQIKWNGILGNFSLKAVNPSHISDFSVYPYFAGRSISGKVTTALDPDESFSLGIKIANSGDVVIASTIVPVAGNYSSFRIDLPSDIKPWNEFSPKLYQVIISLINKNGDIVDTRESTFGFRDLVTQNNHIFLNGERIFLRGTLECCIFPLTGHPPLDIPGWEKVFYAARDYGLNHLRFHSWCPPEAAFAAADRIGMYLQIELPNWSLDYGSDTALTGFINREADRIMQEYGNHPSFCLMSMGNELEGDFDQLNGLLTRLKSADPRHLYTTTTYSFQKGHGVTPEPVDDFYITQNTEKGWIRGQGVFDQYAPDFKTDYTQSIDHINLPVVSHEIGQYSVFPDMKEIEKYTGILIPTNFKAVENDLKIKGLSGDRTEKYTVATGKFATLLYKEEIERALKTDGLSGFQLLDLHDFPGQGTALVGVLNAFWESKGFTGGEQWRMFCNPVVPLLWFDKAVYTTAENFSAEYGFANYYEDFSNITVRWNIRREDGTSVLEDSMFFKKILKGKTTKSGRFTIPLEGLAAPAKYQVSLALDGTEYKNQWDIWIYNPDVETDDSGILFTTSFSEAIAALENGQKVLLNPDIIDIEGITGKFVPVFWSPVHFPNQPGTMGLLMDPGHGAFKSFPTDSYSNWQWWDLCKKSKTVVLDSLSVDPIVTVIDNFFKNRRLGNIFEAKVGHGNLLFSSVDLHTELADRPVARQLKSSLLRYMNSSGFHPASSLSVSELSMIRSAARFN